jgi:hypothetical protein
MTEITIKRVDKGNIGAILPMNPPKNDRHVPATSEQHNGRPFDRNAIRRPYGYE